MSTYYTIIAGQRYDATLIKSARAKVSGAGDGRISKQDALELWIIATDGGRITEIEEATFDYLQKTLTWTEPAIKWLEENIASELYKTKSYFKVVDGLRYDRKLLEAADKLVADERVKQISFEDAQLLFPIVGEFEDVSIIEERSVAYVMENYRWTAKAEKWFLEQLGPLRKQSEVGPFIQYVLDREYRFKRFEFAYSQAEAYQQMLAYEGTVTLNLALSRALYSLVNDTGEKSLKSLFSYVDEPITEFLEQTRLVLLPGDMASEPALSSFPSPSRGESIRDNWLFGLDLFDLSDDIFWVVVPRDGKSRGYNYIGGPNVGDIYHIVETEQYFTIQVLSGGVPVQDAMVEVQAPTGKYILNKSDAEGKVLIMGPTGKYTVFTSNGLRKQEETFEWDGEGAAALWRVEMEE